jgi:hypothetical protein
LREGFQPIAEAKIVRLKCGLGLLPLTDELFEALGDGDCGEFMKLSDAIANVARRLSVKTPITYAEAEYFGGVGAQSVVVWSEGKKVLEIIREQNAINRALNFLGIHLKDGCDEFDEIGLGRCRSTNDWLRNSEAGK